MKASFPKYPADMLTRRRLLLLSLQLTLPLLAVSAQSLSAHADGGNSGPGSGNSGHGGGDDDDGDGDHDDNGDDGDDQNESEQDESDVRELEHVSNSVHSGKAKPLAKLLSYLRLHYPGKVIDVKLLVRKGLHIYRVKLLAQSGRVTTLRLDALTFAKL